jgi:hypothetical protein
MLGSLVINSKSTREPAMNLTLARTQLNANCTLGTITLPDGTVIYSLELPWKDNQKDVSCVPPGVYQLIPYTSPKHGSTWYLENLDLGVGDAGAERSYCEIHSANWTRQLEGCIALGLEDKPMFDPKEGETTPAVEQSDLAINRIKNELGIGSYGNTLTII